MKSASKQKKSDPEPRVRRAVKPVHPKTGNDFGDEGTNKTQSAPKPDNALPEDLGIRPKIEKSPYTRG